MSLESRLLDHVERCRFEALPPAVVQAAVTFVTDSIGVGLAGRRHPRLAQVRAAVAQWGHGDHARDWATGDRFPAPTAALLNAWQIHNQEFDCVHEGAVVHPLATILPALLAHAERRGAEGRPVGGPALIEALAVAVDVAATIGLAHAAPMRFFRPAMCGLLGATLGLARLEGLSRVETAQALGIAYSQLAGTMQAHAEGSPMLALQVGLAARAAVTALDLARAGFAGPLQVMEGPFGYFDLFDAPRAARAEAIEAVFAQLETHPPGQRLTELSHKPFPTGRAAHGALDGLATLMREHGLHAAHVQRIELGAPPLVLRLVGRPWRAGLDVNTARLCLPYLAATLLTRGSVGLEHFTPQALADASLEPWAARVAWVPNGVTDPNALAPQTLVLTRVDGVSHRIELPAVLGHPARALTPAQQRAKFDACCRFAGLPDAQAQALHDRCQALPRLTDLAEWLTLMRVPAAAAPTP